MSAIDFRQWLRRLGVLHVALFLGLAHADVLNLVTEIRPPRQMLEGDKVVGTATERVERVMKVANIPYSIAVYPFARSFQMAQFNKNTCIFSIARNSEREKMFVWVDTPIMQIRRVFFARVDAGIKLRSLEDAKAYRIGTYNGDAMDSYFRQQGFIVDAAPADINNLHKLIAKRIDLWVNDEQIGLYEIDENGKRDTIIPVFTIMTQNVFLACNPKLPSETVKKLNRAARSVLRN